MNNILKYNLPKNFDPNNQEFDIFKNSTSETYENPQIKFIKNCRIANNSVVFYYFKVFEESCISKENAEEYQKGYKFFLKFIFPQLNFSNKRFLLITDEWTTNYYHWHIFALSKLSYLKDNNFLEDSLIFLPKKYKKIKFVLSSLKKFGINDSQIVFVRRKSNIKVKEVVLPKLPQQHHQIIKVRDELIKNKIDTNLGNKIYISRQGQKLRFVENENEVTQLLEKYGFKKILIDDYSYNEQISIANNAKYIVSPHGAGITNILFMNQEASIFELAAKPDPIKPITDYYKLATHLQINYYYQECEMRGEIQNFHMSSLFVDVKKLEENLKLMLKNE